MGDGTSPLAVKVPRYRKEPTNEDDAISDCRQDGRYQAGQQYSFGLVKAAQARGDFAVLVDRQRRALRVHLGSDVTAGLSVLGAAVARAMEERDD